MLKSAVLLVSLGWKFFLKTQVVLGQDSIGGVKYRKKCWTGKQSWWWKMPSHNLSPLCVILCYLSTFRNFCKLQAGADGLVWSGEVGFSGQLRNAMSLTETCNFSESSELDVVLFFTFSFLINPCSRNGITSPDHQRWVLQVFEITQEPKSLPHMPQNRTLILPRITDHSFCLLSFLLLKQTQSFCRIS